MKKLIFNIKNKIQTAKSQLTVKVLVSILIFIALPFTLLTTFNRQYVSGLLKGNVEDRISKTVDNNLSFVEDALSRVDFFAEHITANQETISLIQKNGMTQTFFEGQVNEHKQNALHFFKDARVILIDADGTTFSYPKNEYPADFYSTESRWLENTKTNRDEAVWSMFEPLYKTVGDDRRYISMARAVQTTDENHTYLGVLIVSITEQDFCNMMLAFGDRDDDIYIFNSKNELICSTDETSGLPEEKVIDIYREKAQNARYFNEKYGRYTYYFNSSKLNRFNIYNGETISVLRISTDSQYVTQMTQLDLVIGIVTFSVIGFAIFMSLKISHAVVRPVKKLTVQMQDYEVGHHNDIVKTERVDEIGRLNNSFSEMAERIDSLFEKYKQEEKAKENSQFESMQAQLNPHFLFNTLGTIRFMLVVEGNTSAVSALDSLNSLLRYSMGKDSGIVPLRDEIDNISNFVKIHNLRFQDGIDLTVNIDNELLALRTMKFILQPIVENAIIHGKPPERPDLNILVTAETDGEKLFVTVSDDGVGFSVEMISGYNENGEKKERRHDTMTGIGMSHVNKMLKLKFGSEYGLSIANNENGGASVTFALPLLNEESEEQENETNHDS